MFIWITIKKRKHAIILISAKLSLSKFKDGINFQWKVIKFYDNQTYKNLELNYSLFLTMINGRGSKRNS